MSISPFLIHVCLDALDSLQTNVLSTFLLGILSIPILQKTAKLPSPNGESFKPHLVIVASDCECYLPMFIAVTNGLFPVHCTAKFPQQSAENSITALDELGPTTYSPDERYATTKLLDILLTRELGERFKNEDFIITSVNPGFSKSEFHRDFPKILRL